MGLLDTLLEGGASFDWISPLLSIAGDILNGPSHTFLIPYDSTPLSGREIQWMLGKHKIKTWGLMVVSGTLMVSVKLNKARWAQHLLQQQGVPIENPLPSQPRQPKRQKAAHARPVRKRKYYVCSHCGSKFWKKHLKCPNCGAPG